jgi:hypothetical protein
MSPAEVIGLQVELAYVEGLNMGGREVANRILAALDSAGLAVVPKEPTEEMVWHGASSYDHPNVFMGGPSHMGRRMAERIYHAMVAAAKGDSQ